MKTLENKALRRICGKDLTMPVFHTVKILELSASLPVKIEVVNSEEMINKVLSDVCHVVEKGLVEVTDTNVVKWYRWEGESFYEAIVKRLIRYREP
jgi:PII-like signaling protein